MTPPPGRQLEITLLQERSSGTFAKVYLAESRGSDNLSRIVAVKVLKEQWSESSEVLDRTYDEARLLARLHHKNILRVEALTELEGQPAIVMEFVDGVDLKQLIERLARRGERIPPRAAYKIAQDTASALEASYFKVPYGRSEPLQVVHRDVKPSNIMVSVEGEVKVLDFGTARSNYEGRLARTGALRFGSLKYMSPERREGDRGDHTTDVYALGLVLLEMLRGESLPLLPLDANEHDEALADILQNLGPLGLPNEQWDDSLRQTLAAMCASQPSHRLNASQVVQLLRAFAEQASGASLDTFAAEVISPIAKEIYGAEHQGPLTGTRLLVQVDRQGEGAPDGRRSPTLTPDRAPDRGSLDKGALKPVPATGAPRPGASMVPGAARAAQAASLQRSGAELFDEELMPTVLRGGSEAQEIRAAAAAVSEPAPNTPADQGGWFTPQEAPGRSFDPGQVQGSGFTVDPEPEADEPAEAPRNRTMIILAIAAATVLVLLLGAAAVSLGVYFFVLRKDPGAADTPVVVGTAPADATPARDPAPPPDAPVSPPPAAGVVKVDLRAADGALLQWIKITDSQDQQLLKGSPTGSGELPAGTYTLAAKMVGRPAQKATLNVDKDLTLTCRTDEKSQVLCAAEGGQELVLAP